MKTVKKERKGRAVNGNSVLQRMSAFLPHEKKFFVLFEDLAGKAVEAAGLLVGLGTNYSKVSQTSERLERLEDEADSVVHQILQGLFYDHTRVTEEKGDIRYFAHNLDNVIDGVTKAMSRLTFAHLQSQAGESGKSGELPKLVSEFSPIILEASQEIKTAVGCLRDLKCEGATLERCYIRINELENEADKTNRKWLRILMTAPVADPNEVLERMVLKEIVDILEDTMDQCEDVANILETFRLKGGI
ncbi:hypothetical protein B6V00_04785 [ANME-1 cluster archaeon ex4572_4]|nr:MAG: hypothetical protein B6V00_04785 [ANME-1 cluster archaeon ex4572_4]PXF51272.1 MAG: hypothetical protein C4B55_02420 [Methanophagales archaeon]RLF93053.1 MAG: hypothetical protein DRN50_07840 [Thermococci archaeon]HDN68193.1 DUF47 family protein [Methanomicrobia archaeon]